MFQLAEITINYKPIQKLSAQPQINKSQDAYHIFLAQWGEDLHYKEHCKLLLLSRSNKVLGIATVSSGGTSGTVIDPKNVFQTALMANASFIILAHNHPSGNLKPSQADISLTKKMTDAGKFMDLLLLDHLILAEDSYYSFGDEGLM
ncbi:DNA repair protein RadC [Pedobacter sp. UYP24]